MKKRLCVEIIIFGEEKNLFKKLIFMFIDRLTKSAFQCAQMSKNFIQKVLENSSEQNLERKTIGKVSSLLNRGRRNPGETSFKLLVLIVNKSHSVL
jgi:hypothetical protein